MIAMDLLARIAALEEKLHSKANEVSAIQLGVVTENNDPSGQRRIRVTRENQAGLSQSYWIQCGRSQSHTDEPLPAIGTSVLFGCCDNDPHDLYLLRTLANDTNPVDKRQENPILDHSTEVQGDERHNITGKRFHDVRGEEKITIGGNQSLNVSGGMLDIRSDLGSCVLSAKDSITVKNDAGASLTLFTNGSIKFQDNAGRIVYLGGLSDNQCYWNLNNTSIQMINAANFSINGKQIATVGAIDTRGDTIVNRGW